MRDFKGLKVWEKAHELVLAVHRATKAFPSDERFGLTDQLRRAVSSIPANIAEGCGRDGDRELARFLSIAGGSASEVEYHLLLARDLGYLPQELHQAFDREINEIKKMLRALRERLASR